MNFLKDEELEILTGYKRRCKQREELARQGIPYIKRHDGFPVVSTGVFSNGHDTHIRIAQHEEKPNLEGL